MEIVTSQSSLKHFQSQENDEPAFGQARTKRRIVSRETPESLAPLREDS